MCLSFFFTHPPTPDTYPLSLHDALPISHRGQLGDHVRRQRIERSFSRDCHGRQGAVDLDLDGLELLVTHGSPSRRCTGGDRKSTRLNSSHVSISYAVFCLKKKKKY